MITLQLLDSALGRPLQQWRFSESEKLSIGRAPECDISISDPHVSRLHVELTCVEEGWTLKSLGRNGTWIRGSKVEEVPLTHQTIFQLGATGPMLQILIHDAPHEAKSATLDHIADVNFDFLNINTEQIAEEVTRIAQTEAFQRLEQETQRHRRGEGE